MKKSSKTSSKSNSDKSRVANMRSTEFCMGSKDINISDIRDVALRLRHVDIEGGAQKKLQKNFEYLRERGAKEVIYGLNTGFGPMAHIFISKEKQIELQYNLIRSHAVGLGKYMSPEKVRAIMLVRLQTLMKGHSGVGADVCVLLAHFLNKNITPLVYTHGSVGASGDLVQLAHIAQALIGEGQVLYKGYVTETPDVFRSVLKKEGIKPLSVRLREGLALINGTAVMSGIGALNVHFAKILVEYSVLASALMFEIVEASEEYFSKEISDVRPHAGQKKVGELMRAVLTKSKRIRRSDTRHVKTVGVVGIVGAGVASKNYTKSNDIESSATLAMDQSRQEIYSIRCAVQILGPIFDELMNAVKVVEIEINSVTDNPIVFSDSLGHAASSAQNTSTVSKIVHGGNFHGDYVSYEMDKLKIAITKLSIFSERKLNFLLNDKVNKMFPPFLNFGTVGLDIGLQGLQFVATSTVAENQSLSMPVSIHSISCNNDNQDIVSMGTNSALMAEKVIMNTFDVLAIELTALARAVDFLKIDSKLSPQTKALYLKVRDARTSSAGRHDLVLRKDIQSIVDMLKSDIGANLF